MLVVEKLRAAYGHSQVLFDVNLEVRGGELVALLGRNGMGKTTTIRTIMGLLAARGGAVHFEGASITGRTPDAVARLGVGLVPEGRLIFPTLTVRENLVATAANRTRRAPPWTLDRVTDTVSAATGTCGADGRNAVRWRAADARDRPRTDDEPKAADPRRGNRGLGAAHPLTKSGAAFVSSRAKANRS